MQTMYLTQDSYTECMKNSENSTVKKEKKLLENDNKNV